MAYSMRHIGWENWHQRRKRERKEEEKFLLTFQCDNFFFYVMEEIRFALEIVNEKLQLL